MRKEEFRFGLVYDSVPSPVRGPCEPEWQRGSCRSCSAPSGPARGPLVSSGRSARCVWVDRACSARLMSIVAKALKITDRGYDHPSLSAKLALKRLSHGLLYAASMHIMLLYLLHRAEGHHDINFLEPIKHSVMSASIETTTPTALAPVLAPVPKHGTQSVFQ